MLGVSKTLGMLHKQSNGSSLYSHLCEVLSHLHEADDPYKSLEMLSSYVREVQNPPMKGADLAVPEADPRAPSRKAWIEKIGALAKSAPEPALNDVQDFWTDSRMLRVAGLGFSDDECYALAMSIRSLASKKKGVAMARFWGKILGIKNDYYIAELEFTGKDSLNRNDPLAPLSDDYVEPRGTGANKYVYFCCTSVPGDWVQLPNAIPAQIKKSRAISKLLTGDLSAPIWSHPPFPWTEKELLRCMIARISHSTILAPAGYYQPAEGDGETEPDPMDIVRVAEWSFGVETPNTPGNWVHGRPYLRLNGRVSAPTVPGAEEEIPGLDPAERDRIEARLQAENEADADLSGGPTPLFGLQEEIDHCATKKEEGKKEIAHFFETEPWALVKSEDGSKFKVFGDTSVYTFPDPIGAKCYAVTVVESLRFPGAYTVAQGDKFCNIYVGYGVKKQRAFLPLEMEMAPGKIMDEPEDMKELIQDDAQEEEVLDEGGEGEEGDENEE
jgi:radial spoke head protein 4A